MTTRAFFDKGVYKATVKRFSLGSVLYFIMLFFCTGMMIMLNNEQDMLFETKMWLAYPTRLLLSEDYLYPSVLIAFFVPAVVALLVYRFVHSKKTSIFVHSLPVTRTANYVSTLLGAFTLMALPVILNAVVLGLMAVGGYGGYYGIGEILVWTLWSLAVLFIMFAVSTFSAMCTGNSFAFLGINALLLFVPLLIATVFETVLYEFLFGYTYDRHFLEFALDINPVYFLAEMTEGLEYPGRMNTLGLIAFLSVAVLLYIAGGFIYKYRHTETSEEVAGFKALNPVFKYFIAFLGTLTTFSLFTQFLEERYVLFIFIVILASVIFYFGSEMLLKKTINVWRSYKGYLVFAASFAALMLFFVFTSVLGYETYVPDIDDIDQAAVYHYYYQSEPPFLNNEELNKYIVELHKTIVEGEYRTVLNYDNIGTGIHIDYRLKNGKEIKRRYNVDYALKDAALEKAYEYKEYIKACERAFDDRIVEIIQLSIRNIEIEGDKDTYKELWECIQKDILSLDYNKIRYGDETTVCSFMYLASEDVGYGYLEESPEGERYIGWEDIRITNHFKNTIKWLEEHGYDECVKEILE